jgi:small ligand-binding sensory domain FIST
MPATFQFASALSTRDDAARAAEDVVEQVLPRITGPVDLALVFVTPQHRNTINEIHDYLSLTLRPRITLGVAAGGVIGVRREVEDSPGLSLLTANLPGARLQPFTSDDLEQQWNNNPAAVRSFFTAPNDGQLPAGVILLADPFSTPMTGVLPALTAALPGVPLIGGMASAARQANDNRLLFGDDIRRGGLIGLAVGGSARVDCTVSQGCRAIGKPLIITKAKRNVVFELGGRNALEVARDLLDSVTETDRQLLQTSGWLVGRVINEYKDRFGRGDFLIRQVIGIDPQAGYIAIGDAQVRVGQTIQFHVRDQKTAREDFSLLLEAQKLHDNDRGAGALLFSCNGRGTHLFSEPDTDANLIHRALGDIPLAGFFAGGEIGPVGSENFLHGHTASLAVIRPV